MAQKQQQQEDKLTPEELKELIKQQQDLRHNQD